MPSDRPYAPPEADVGLGQPEARDSTASVVGAIIGLGSYYVAATVTALVVLWALIAQGVAAQQAYARLYELTWYILFAHALGALCLAYGGYWSARLSKSKPRRNALWSGLLALAFSLLQILLPYELPIPAWSNALSLLVPVPAFLLGAWWHSRSEA